MADPSTAPLVAAPPAPSSEPSWVKPGLGFYSVTLFGIALVWTLYEGKDNYVMLMLGAVISLVNQGPWGFFFGNSSSAQKSADTIASDSAAKSAALGVAGPTVPVTTVTTPATTSTTTVTTEPSDAAKALDAKLPAA